MKPAPKLVKRALAAAIICLSSFACGKDSKPEPETSSNASSDFVRTGPVALTDCPATGLWAVCSVETRLKQSGFVAQKSDSAVSRRPGFSVDPEVYTLHRSRLELYIYADLAALARDLPKIDTLRIAPVFLRSGNLAALLFTDDATQAERLSLALTAGAPQGSR